MLTLLTDEKGHFHRPATVIRNFISRRPGSRFPVEKRKYHLYVTYACPWAHRVLIARKLKGLEDIISFSVVHWHLNFRTGWRFVTATDTDAEGENVVPDPLHDNFTHLRELYSETDPDFAARFSVPVLYNKVQQVIVNHESSEIRRRLGIEYQREIDEAHEW
ncbi:glutathione S-transferase [Fusarium oxysporum f. sp. albedinis]|nr:glutathione S-transferase [Fusarium oxysporum f. sp. albedinis]